MSPVLLFVLFLANLLACSITLSVLILALAQRPHDKTGQSVVQFLVFLTCYNFSVMVLFAAQIMSVPANLLAFTTNLTVLAFALCVIASFSLVVSLAGLMKESYQVIARAGVIAALMMQWTLWTGRFFEDSPDQYHRMAVYAPSGMIGALTGLVYIALTLIVLMRHYRRLGLSLAFGVTALLVGQVLAITNQAMREIGVASLFSVVASVILGYRLVRVQLFQPLTMQTTQLRALREVSQALTSPHHLSDVLQATVYQSRSVLQSDLAVIMVESENSPTYLTIGAQDGGSVDLVGRQIEIGEGIGGRVFKMKQSMRVANYSQWEGKTPAVDDLPLQAAVAVPLIYDNEVVGVLTVGELTTGRQFTVRDQAMLEMLAPQAAIAIVNARLRQRLQDAPPHPENV